jgi:Chalcone isomerase-like
VAWRLKAYDSPIRHVLPPDSLEVVLNGAGVRANAFFRVYVIGVYLVEKSSQRKSSCCKAGSVSMTLDFIPGAGTRITVNGEAPGQPIPGEDFYQALLRVWLGDDPVDRKLNGALLGQ